MLVICPDARDFTSMIVTGSIAPLAWALNTMLRRSTGAVSITSAVSAFLAQPMEIVARMSARIRELIGSRKNG
jgi:hypothetical protein